MSARSLVSQPDSHRYPFVPERISRVVLDAFTDPHVYGLFNQLFRQNNYDRRFALGLISAAKGANGESWETRRLAALMLEHQLLKLPVRQVPEFTYLFKRLDILDPSGPGLSVKSSLLREGYTSVDIRDFIREFKRRLSRLKRVHQEIRGEETTENGLRQFVLVSQRDCRLTIGRYLWQSSEVIDRVQQEVRVTKGLFDMSRMIHPCVAEEAERVLSTIPDFEAGIVRGLRDSSAIYWVAGPTSSEVNSLVEYPIGTVVLVIKPPGSDIEIEIKRAGVRGENPVSIVFERDGDCVPSSHRFHGGSIGSLIRWEASGSAILGKIYRTIHQQEAPMSRTLVVNSIYGVPSRKGERHILHYFSNQEIFGAGFRKMKAAMRKAIKAFREERGWGVLSAVGDLGEAAELLSQLGPSQAILVGTSSFRLDRLAAYLSPEGAELYFNKGLEREPSAPELKEFADELLEEILGRYSAAKIEYHSHEQYIDAAFQVTRNRQRADKIYLSIMEQIGRFWGTVAGIGGYSNGESFVARNVGLRSYWDAGDWKVKIVFMDHDELDITGRRYKDFHPLNAIGGMRSDHKHIFGGPAGGSKIKGEIGLLEEIYRVKQPLAARGRRELEAAIKAAYDKTKNAVSTDNDLRELFSKSFIERIRDWDTIAGQFLNSRASNESPDVWRKRAVKFLKKRGYNERLIEAYCTAPERYAEFLEQVAFLYRTLPGGKRLKTNEDAF